MKKLLLPAILVPAILVGCTNNSSDNASKVATQKAVPTSSVKTAHNEDASSKSAVEVKKVEKTSNKVIEKKQTEDSSKSTNIVKTTNKNDSQKAIAKSIPVPPVHAGVDMNKVSYIIGYELSQQFKTFNVKINMQMLKEGLSTASAGKASKFNEEEMTQIMGQFKQELMAKAQKVQEHKYTQAVLNHQKELLNDIGTPAMGPSDAKVAVIEFFDYQCLFCSKLAPAIEDAMAQNPKVKFIFKDFPIFGQRWPASNYAAEVGNIAFKQGGAELYVKYHNAVFATGKDEGKLTNADIDVVAKKLGIDLEKNKALLTGGKKLPPEIQKSMSLALTNLGFQGTPAIIIMPTSGATASNITVFAGYPANPQLGTPAAVKAIEKAIEKAAGK